MKKLENLIPPPAVLLFTLVAMFAISRFDRARILGLDGYTLNTTISVVLAFAGIAITVLGLREFRRSRTTINPLKPNTASNLVTSGVYRFTRNPMYLGMLLVTFSAVAFYGSAWCLIAVVMFFTFITRFQIIPEERAMASLFLEEFDAYKERTRRWL